MRFSAYFLIEHVFFYNQYKRTIMNLAEYEEIKDFAYLEYCDYLQQKYGIGLSESVEKKLS